MRPYNSPGETSTVLLENYAVQHFKTNQLARCSP